MSFTTGDVIDQARSRHSSFHDKRHPDKVGLQFLSTYVRTLSGKIAKIDADALRTEVSQGLPLGTFANGITLPANTVVINVAAVRSDGTEFDVDVVPEVQRNDLQIPTASCWQIGSTLFLRPPAQNWQGLASIRIGVNPVTALFTTLKNVVPLPDASMVACIEAVAAFFGRRGGFDAGMEKPDATALSAWASSCEGDYLGEVADRLTGVTFRTRETYTP